MQIAIISMIAKDNPVVRLTSVEEENELFFYNGVESSPLRRVLKILRGSPKVKAQRARHQMVCQQGR